MSYLNVTFSSYKCHLISSYKYFFLNFSSLEILERSELVSRSTHILPAPVYSYSSKIPDRELSLVCNVNRMPENMVYTDMCSSQSSAARYTLFQTKL